MENYKKMGLCQGRHEIPGITEYLFGNIINPLDVEGLETEVSQKLQGITKLNLYVTGLTVALVSVINICANSNIELTLYHFDRESGDYYPQRVKFPAPCVHGGYYQCC